VKKRYEKFQTTYSLILMDYCMPVCNGFEATIKIRKFLNQSNPNLKQPFIVCLTSYTENSFKREAQEAGMDYF